MNKLKDIKPLVGIDDHSLMLSILLFIVIMALLLLGGWYQKQKTKSKQNQPLTALKKLDFKDSRACAYQFTLYAESFINEHNRVDYQQINADLSHYKYKKQVDDLPDKLINNIKKFIAHV
jgi:FtsZ-interacting cell division protein ZipA